MENRTGIFVIFGFAALMICDLIRGNQQRRLSQELVNRGTATAKIVVARKWIHGGKGVARCWQYRVPTEYLNDMKLPVD